jgi:hypothetical protein
VLSLSKDEGEKGGDEPRHYISFILSSRGAKRRSDLAHKTVREALRASLSSYQPGCLTLCKNVTIPAGTVGTSPDVLLALFVLRTTFCHRPF